MWGERSVTGSKDLWGAREMFTVAVVLRVEGRAGRAGIDFG